MKCTLTDIEKIQKEFLVPTDIAPFLGCTPYMINVQAKQDCSKLGFPVLVLGTTVRINKELFVKYFRGELPLYGAVPLQLIQNARQLAWVSADPNDIIDRSKEDPKNKADYETWLAEKGEAGVIV